MDTVVTEATHSAMFAAVAQAQREGWQLESDGPGWAQLGRRGRVNHGALLLLSIVTFGLGLIVWAIAAGQGPKWERILVTADANGAVQVQPMP